jgi:hypothetical protein
VVETEIKAVSISFDNCVEEFIAADHLYYQSTLLAKIDKVVAVLLVFGGLLLIYAAGLRWWTLIPFLLAILEWFNLLSPRPLVIRYWFKHNPKLCGTYHLTFTSAGILWKTKSIDSRIAWDQYTRVLEDSRMYLLIYGKRLYSVVPKREFKDEDESTRFRSLVAKHIVASNQQVVYVSCMGQSAIDMHVD